MINILDCNTFKKIEDVALLWNEEVGFIYPITDLLFKHNIIDCPYLSLGTSFVAVENEKVVGFILSKIWDGNKEIPLILIQDGFLFSMLLENIETKELAHCFCLM